MDVQRNQQLMHMVPYIALLQEMVEGLQPNERLMRYIIRIVLFIMIKSGLSVEAFDSTNKVKVYNKLCGPGRVAQTICLHKYLR